MIGALQPESSKRCLMSGTAAAASGTFTVQRMITINAWNEWTEGSYLEPDTVHGLGYLKAIRDAKR